MCQSTNVDIRNMDGDLFDTVNIDKLERYVNDLKPVSTIQTSSTSNTTTAISTLTSTSVTNISITKKAPNTNIPSNVNCINFLQYAEVKLLDKDDILIFYRYIYNQGKLYNTHITKLDDITNVLNATVTSTLSDTNTINLTEDIIYQKFRKKRQFLIMFSQLTIFWILLQVVTTFSYSYSDKSILRSFFVHLLLLILLSSHSIDAYTNM